MWRLVARWAAWLSLAGILGCSASVPAETRDDRSMVRVGVVDLRRVFDGWSRVTDLTSALQAEKAEANEALGTMAVALRQKRSEADNLPVGGARRIALEAQIGQLQAAYDLEVKRWNEVIATKLDEGLAVLYNEIREVVARYAANHGLTHVLEIDAHPVISTGPGSAKDQIDRRGLLYAAPGYNITDAILADLEPGK